MNDDFNTALTIGHIFNLLKKVNALHAGQLEFSAVGEETFDRMKSTVLTFTEDVLGFKTEESLNSGELLHMLLDEYKEAKEAKNYDKVDAIRAKLKSQGIIVKDMKGKVDWAMEE